MKKFIAIATAATFVIAAAAPANAQMSAFKSFGSTAANADQIVHKTGRKGRRIAGAIALGLLGAAVIAGHARASEIDQEDAHERRCNKWRRWCNDGESRACRKFDNRC